ncbi:MAG: 30S ribosomal protein S7 [Vicinamibacteria bacterium]
MPRRGLIARRQVAPDPLYNSALVTKFINCMMYGGKRSTSQPIMYSALSVVQQKTSEDPQVPAEVNPNRRTSLALRWPIGFARKRPERSMIQQLANEILDAANLRGGAVKKKEDTHKMAEANKAFAHYRW